MAKMLCCASELKGDHQRLCNEVRTSRTCEPCDSFKMYDAKQLILKCPSVNDLRQTILTTINESCKGFGEQFLSRGGGTQVRRGAAHALRISRKKGSFLRPPHVRDFVKEGYFFLPRYEVWGSKSPYNPWNIRSSDAEWLPKWLGCRVCCCHLLPLNTQRIIKSKVKIPVPVHPMSVFW